ncbi:MAG: heparinase II/III family protein [candidate division KSB1 bacterium]|nr:heparinase II/III family protein [candidate division KSB1 bacterium]MDZ7272777.1 heparinase II/III family protein [candidate division KSB1 bacterium]MDZ7284199.1 heparinase II/III family protein [candidate division KSB1 bacterium]MDZ7297403.1 heparinase II/III family protein [candidate division KSB1 bacterium]MDZ7306537.1 heparinase II/III family protein [candidate division KSB1 bacterium]
MNLKKLKSMSLDELGYRLKLAGTRKLSKLSHRRRDFLAPARFLAAFELPSDYRGPYAEAVSNRRWRVAEEYLLEHMRARVRGQGDHGLQPKYFFAPQDRLHMLAALHQHLPHVLPTTLAAANRYLAHEFTFFGVRQNFGDEIDWHRDPVSLQAWPRDFYTDLRFYGQSDGRRQLPGDVKQVWELNRQQHFTILGKAFWLTGETKYALELFSQMQSWMRQNPYLHGVNWTSALEVGLRALSWISGYFFCLEAEVLEPRTHALLLRMLQLHGHYLNRHLSFFTSPYNHLVGEAVALFHLGTLFPELPRSRQWRATGWKILCEEVTRQFHADGMSVEQAVSYHHFTLSLYVLALLLAERNGLNVPPEMRNRLERALEFSMWSQQPDGRQPMIGDNDDATAFLFASRPPWDFRHLLALGALLFQRGDFKQQAGECDECCLWLLGPQSPSRFASLKSFPPSAATRLFADSGYAIVRSGWGPAGQYLIFDCGPQSHGLHADETVSTAHGHADALAFTLCAHGEVVLRDSGMWCYNGELNWQNHFRSGCAHNTITIDGRSACHIVGRLGYSHVPAVTQTRFISRDDFTFVEAEYVGFGLKLRHRRGIFYRPQAYWLILDSLEGEGEHLVDRWFHFDPLSQLERAGEWIVARRPQDKNLLLGEICPPAQTAEFWCGGEKPEAGWMAPGYGRRLPAPVLRLRASVTMPAQFTTLLMPVAAALPPRHFAARGRHGTASSEPFVLQVRADDWEDRIIFNFTGRRQCVAEVSTDAEIIFEHRGRSPARHEVTMVRGRNLTIANRTIFALEKIADMKRCLTVPATHDGPEEFPDGAAAPHAMTPAAGADVES